MFDHDGGESACSLTQASSSISSWFRGGLSHTPDGIYVLELLVTPPAAPPERRTVEASAIDKATDDAVMQILDVMHGVARGEMSPLPDPREE